MKTMTPPIKSQGIKTKLVSWISSAVPDDFNGRWFEPFLGTGVVALNLAPKNSILCDINPHLINFYNGIIEDEITPQIVRSYLEKEGDLLREKGKEHYYFIRDRFNEKASPLDFLFVNRAGFNGMIRFNRKGGFNIPFCHKPNRFAKAYVTKITNQVSWANDVIKSKNFEFICQDFEKTILMAKKNDLIYCDPPYIGRHVDYFNGWNEENETRLSSLLTETSAKFILSSWHHNDFRRNEFMETHWANFEINTRDHFYHVGGSEKNRKSVVEALITNFRMAGKIENLDTSPTSSISNQLEMPIS
ncbi:Modification methylase EcoRV (Adenine-specific methyltransferase EcoRV) (M.EcoRV) [hydrothermal vent metagenome]|uniref:site-specific DNA-methyltransferase (adenine-specific) n=1 Tax=hydrothermal vent metagenome TaxID=652676 RepID=A0A3B0SML3_9ZZZZ